MYGNLLLRLIFKLLRLIRMVTFLQYQTETCRKIRAQRSVLRSLNISGSEGCTFGHPLQHGLGMRSNTNHAITPAKRVLILMGVELYHDSCLEFKTLPILILNHRHR